MYIYIYIYTCASVRKCTSSIIASHHPLSLCFLSFKYVCIYLCLLVGLDLMSHLHVSPKPCEAKATCNLITNANACSGDTPVNKGIGTKCSGDENSCDAATCCEAFGVGLGSQMRLTNSQVGVLSFTSHAAMEGLTVGS